MKTVRQILFSFVLVFFIAQTCFAEVVVHKQGPGKARHPFWNLQVTEGAGKISVVAGKFYIHGKEYDMPTLTDEAFPKGARLSVEKTAGGVGYLLDTTGYAEANSFGVGVGAVLVVWNEGGKIHVLQSYEK